MFTSRDESVFGKFFYTTYMNGKASLIVGKQTKSRGLIELGFGRHECGRSGFDPS